MYTLVCFIAIVLFTLTKMAEQALKNLVLYKVDLIRLQTRLFVNIM